MHTVVPSRRFTGIAFALSLGLILAACTTSPGDPADAQQSLYDQGVELAAQLAANDPQIASQQVVAGPDYFGYALTQDALAVDDSTQAEFLNNQLIVRATSGTTAQQVAELVEPVGGKVVGINAALDDYQILLDNNYSVAELDELARQIATDPVVPQVRQNLPFIANAPMNVDPVDDPVWQGHWGATLGNGDGSAGNWGMQAIGAPVIWDIESELSPVTVGAQDFFFDGQLNPDIDQFTLFGVEGLEATEDDAGSRTHGMHVAGTVAATGNNSTGVAGVVPKANLLVASYSSMVRCYDLEGKDLEGENCRSHAFADTLGFSTLVSQGAKVINYSMGYGGREMAFAEQGQQKTQELLAKQAEATGQDLVDLINRGYDFLIVAAGGNESAGMSADKKGNWLPPSDPKAVAETFDNAVAAKWNDMIAMQEYFPELRDHVISVGAMGSVRENGGQGFEVGSFSNYGTDLLAPGVGIVSTMEVFGSEPHDSELSPHKGCPPDYCPTIQDNTLQAPEVVLEQPEKLQDKAESAAQDGPVARELPAGYSVKSGTSMAAPHVTGVAGAIWSANPELSAAEVRKIILDTAESIPAITKNPHRLDRTAYPRLNGAAAIRDALASRSDWHDQRDYSGIPTALQGTWCQPSSPKNCLNLADLFEAAPLAELESEFTAVDPTGRTSAASAISVCLDGPCETANDAFKLKYYPPGAEWECVYNAESDACDPATRDKWLLAHDIAWPRLVHQVKQADGSYVDAEPFVLDLRAKGDFSKLPFDLEVARLPADTRDYADIPQELQGTWCVESESGFCLNFVDYFEANPQSGFDQSLEVTFPKDEPSTHVLCLDFDSEYNGVPTCSTAGSAFFMYFPAGVPWDCVADGAARYGFTACSPDYTQAHRTNEPRLARILNHQHSSDYVDVEPMYLTPSARGTFANLN